MPVWKLDPNYSDKEYALYTTDYGYVGSIWKTAEYSEKGDFYAAFIVRAVNGHDDLVAKLEMSNRFLEDLKTCISKDDEGEILQEISRQQVVNNKVLAKAKGEQAMAHNSECNPKTKNTSGPIPAVPVINLELAHKVLQDKAASFWLKETVKRGLERDIVDVQNEIELLNEVFGVKS